MHKTWSIAALAIAMGVLTTTPAWAKEGKVVLIHTGDIHGHLEGGLARVYSVIQKIRRENRGRTLLINTSDTLQGSAEAFARGGGALT